VFVKQTEFMHLKTDAARTSATLIPYHENTPHHNQEDLGLNICDA